MLDHIKMDKCPECGAKIREMKKEQQHCNGHWNEVLVFDCYARYEFSPNFMKTEQVRDCQWSTAYKKIRKDRQDFLERLRVMIQVAEVDDKFKKHLLAQFQYTRHDSC